MLFVCAVRYLRSEKAVVEQSSLISDCGRFYRVYDPTDTFPAMWLSPLAVSTLADLLKETESKDDNYENPHSLV